MDIYSILYTKSSHIAIVVCLNCLKKEVFLREENDDYKKFVSIKLSGEEKRQLEKCASLIKLPLATWIKHVVFKERNKIMKEWKEK